jgi:hypothetical protein
MYLEKSNVVVQKENADTGPRSSRSQAQINFLEKEKWYFGEKDYPAWGFPPAVLL